MTTTANTLAAPVHLPRRGRAANDSPLAIVLTTPEVVAPRANTPPARVPSAPSVPARAGSNHSTQGAHASTPNDHAPGSNNLSSLPAPVDRRTSAGEAPPIPAISHPTTIPVSSGWAELRLYAEIFDDLQRARIRFENQIRSATVDEDFAAGHLERLAKSEREAAKILKRTLKHAAPHLYAWAQETRGVGEHTLARLLGATGDPRRAQPHHWQGEGADRILVADEPYDRNVAKLWAYCGCGDPDRKRRKGMTAADGAALGNPRAKVAIHLMAEAQVKSRGFFRDVYDQARVEYKTRDGWSLGHQHAAALRKVKKELLKAIWRAS